MQLNTKVLDDISNSDSKVLVVTKYLATEETLETIKFMEENYPQILEGFGENRVVALREKDLPREKTHFIGNIQTKEIKYITKHCSTIHSVDSEKHLKKMEEICAKQGNWVEIYLQINIDETKQGGVKQEDIPKFLQIIGELENVSLIGFSAIGKSEFTLEEKKGEFQLLKDLRNKYIQNGFISAGTSLDYEIAVEEKIDVVRLGKILLQ